jgi:beta-carotene hydroxylase
VGLLGTSLTLTATGRIPLVAGFAISLLAFNLSLTLWHECVHNTVFRSHGACTGAGILVSLLLLFPGYFALRRDHWMHHKHQGDPERDPVYPRVQCRPWAFPFRLAWAALFPLKPMTPEHRLTIGERLGDAANYVIVAGLAAGSVVTGLWPVLVFAWVLPRIVIFPIHAFYVCYLPHSGFGRNVYETYRIVLRNPLTRYLTLYHSFHGLHHLWPTVPWHAYRRTFQERRAELEERGVRILGQP